jgi:hypothetical protein
VTRLALLSLALVALPVVAPTAPAIAQVALLPVTVTPDEPVMGPEDSPSELAARIAALDPAQVAAAERDLGMPAAEYVAQTEAALDASAVVETAIDRGLRPLHVELDGTTVTVHVDDRSELAYWRARGLEATLAPPPPPAEPVVLQPAVDLRGGDLIYYVAGGLGRRCSVGALGTNALGAPELMTAGHCAATGADQRYSAFTITAPGLTPTAVSSTVIGTPVPGSFLLDDGYDHGLVAITSTAITPVPAVTTYGSAQLAPDATPPVVVRDVVAANTLPVGSPICKSGATTGWTCGTVTRMQYDQQVSSYVADGIVTNACMLPGDSGGSALVGSALVGVNSGSLFGIPLPGQPVDESTAERKCATTPPANRISFMVAHDITTPGWRSARTGYGSDFEVTVVVDEPVIQSPAPSAAYTPEGSLVVSGTLAERTPRTSVTVRVGPRYTTSVPVLPDGTWSVTVPAAELPDQPVDLWVMARWGQRSASLPQLIVAEPGVGWGSSTTVGVRFRDVLVNNPFYWEITWLAHQGVTTGFPDGTFNYLGSVNRDAMAAFLYRSAGSPSWTPPALSPFVDVPVGSQFYREITWLAAQGVTTGYPDGTYRPTSPVARDAMAAFLYRFAGRPAVSLPPSSPFTDVPTSNQFYREITWLAASGVTTGYPDGTYRPLQSVARDAMAAFLNRFAYVAPSS